MGIINFNQGNNYTSIENDFIINHMANLSGDFVKIYLYMLMRSESHEDISIDEVASKFGIFSSEIVKALDALSREGLCQFEKNGENFSLSFEKKKDVKPFNEPKIESMPTPSISFNTNMNNEFNASINSFNNNEEVPTTFLSNSPYEEIDKEDDKLSSDSVLGFTNNVNNNTSSAVYDYMKSNVSSSDMASLRSESKESDKYSVDELAFLLSANTDISELKNYIEKTYGATFNASTLQSLVSIASCDYVPISALKTIVSYLYNNNQKITKLTNVLNALEQKAIEINEKGLKTDDEINEYLTMTSQNYMTIVRRFGIIGRGVAPAEKVLIDKWLYTYKMPMDLICSAIDKTIMKTGKASFDYCEAIIKGWKDDGIMSMDALNKTQNAPAKVNTFKPSTDNKVSTKFNNYTIQTNQSKLSDFEMGNLTKLMNKYGNK